MRSSSPHAGESRAVTHRMAACEDVSVQRFVTAELDLTLMGTVDLVFSLAVGQGVPVQGEQLSFAQAEREYAPTELVDAGGGRLHRFRAEPGPLQVRYRAVVPDPAPIAPPSELERITFLRPSRYCPSDEVFGQARRQFSGLHGRELVDAVTRFVEQSVTYSPGLSAGTDSAVTTLATGQGVCRDYAHVVIALLRAMDVPARYTSCYAPGLRPMDFHAVAEAWVEGAWHVIDATRLADRRTLVRIATGRDAADCAFLSYHGANVILDRLHVDATVLEDGPDGDPDDFAALVQIA